MKKDKKKKEYQKEYRKNMTMNKNKDIKKIKINAIKKN